MRYIQQGATGFVIGPFVNSGDGISPVSSLVASSLNGYVLNNGTTTSYIPTTFTHQANGNYYATTSTIFSSISNDLRVSFSNPLLFAPVWDDFSVLSSSVYSSFFGTGSLSSDPWLTPLPASYTSGEAGYIVGIQKQIPIVCTVIGGSTTTIVNLSVTSGTAPVTANVLVGRGCLFQPGSGPNGLLVGAYPLIIGSTAVSGGNITIQVAPLPQAPVAGDIAWII